MTEPVNETCHIGTERQRPLERAIAELAERQHGVVALEQLRALSVTGAAARKRVARGYLHPVHRGVYAVGRPGLAINGWRLAAVLAIGPDAVLSHRSAAGLWGLRRDGRASVDVTVPRAGLRARAGIDLHRRTRLTAADVSSVQGIPCTTVARTLVDLGEVSGRRGVEQAVEQAEVLGLFDQAETEAALRRAGKGHGPALLTSVLRALTATPTLTESELEEAFLELVRGAGLRDPEVNAPMTLPDGTAIRVDFLWRDLRLAVETDGHRYHRTRQSRERDTRRDQLLRLAAYEPVRFTAAQILGDGDWVRRTLLALASRADGDRSGRAGPQAA